MPTPKTLEDYGAPFVDLGTMENPTGEQSAEDGNRQAEDVAQMTRTSNKVFASFVPTATAAPTSVAVVAHWSQWGSADVNKPTITKDATGEYTIEWPATMTDGLNEVETLALRAGHFTVHSALDYAPTPIETAITANSISIRVLDTTFTETDNTNLLIKVWVE